MLHSVMVGLATARIVRLGRVLLRQQVHDVREFLLVFDFRLGLSSRFPDLTFQLRGFSFHLRQLRVDFRHVLLPSRALFLISFWLRSLRSSSGI